MATWWAYKRGILGLPDLRVWLAIFEVKARRCGNGPNRSFAGVEHEIAVLVQSDVRHVAASLRRLERTGYLKRTRTAFWPQWDLDRLEHDEREEFWLLLLRQVKNHRRRIPVPRRVLRLLTTVTRPVFWATTVGHLLRCMYYRDRQCAPDGRCKASWIADVFGVDTRNVKSARRELMHLGMLIMDPTDQCSMNRWGPRARFNLSWKAEGRAGTPPRTGPIQRELPPPINRELASRMVTNQERRQAPAVGLSTARSWHVDKTELNSPPALQRLFERCVRQGTCRESEAARLAFFATAARALRVATSNAPGLFATLVRTKHWGFATLADEDAARRWLRQLAAGRDRGITLIPKTGPVSEGPPCRPPEAAATVLHRLLPNLLPDSARTDPARPIEVRSAASNPLREFRRDTPVSAITSQKHNGARPVRICRTPSVAIGSSPREAGRPLGPDGDGRGCSMLPVPALSRSGPNRAA
ncbi:MAG: hypothetical protein AMXMBFR47_23810 [Planctomycetota bacterium]